MSDLTDADLEAMEKRWQEATTGPWEARSAPHPDEPISKADYMASLLKPEFNQKSLMVVIRDLPDEYLVVAIVGDGPNSGPNAEFIARSYDDIPALIAALREARAERKQEIHLVFDGPPEHVAGRFVEAENSAGESISVGRWEQRGEYWHLIIPRAAEVERVQRLEKVAKAAKVVVDNRDDRFTDDGLKSWSSPDDMIALEDALAELDAGEVCGG